ncbi:hypothetical protein G6F46_008656 [Rhizopus delemar]|uniref:MTOR-associated protein MEAK7 n=2 Tax=Rhizopus TaxID=4842 RepID=A0A9P6YS54_9FUNG|nr:hypothetical protein G6F55_007500 [Rhizopus delemar]KAG1534591.1 hypothetical protein G6F51_012012 [Rhizopus arrhizus]KAG1493860.1 hypothetical protein G6F54_008287 [Rhizopus delemar]KAG1498320.1 hypothetical protein G6F53_011769 [Rhizopus delemar]KAG1512340.1 hypothetical protein G6F52_010434 [Rhizopus delemar]
MGNQSSREDSKEAQLLSKWSKKEQEQISQSKELPSYFSKELYTSLTEHATRLECLETAYKILKLKEISSVYPIFQACVEKYNASFEKFVYWTVISSIPLWFQDNKVNVEQYDPTRLVGYFLNYALEQKKQQEDSMDWLSEDQDESKEEKKEDDDWKVKSTSSPSCINRSEFDDWLVTTPSFFSLFYLVTEYAFLGSTEDNLHKRRLDHLASPQLGSSFSELLSPYDYFMLTQHLPPSSLSNDTKEIKHQLLFSSKRDGVSWQVFVNKIVEQGATMVVIRAKDGTIFGGYADEAWEYQNTDWYGNSSNFLFRLEPSCRAWLGQNTNDHYQYLCWGKKSLPNGFGMGGQFDYCGLWIDSDFLHGHSRAGPLCSTYKSPQLTKNDTFLVDQVEVWLMRPIEKDQDKMESKGVLNYSEDMEFMEMAVNKIQLIGRVGTTPVSTEFSENRRVYNYTLATSETRPDKEDNLIKRTQWHRISFWTNSDWFSKVKKGDLVYVEGALRYSDYTDKEGISRTKAEINQSSFKILNPARPKQEDEEEE